MNKLSISIIALALLCAQCGKKSKAGCIKGKVVRLSCASAVIQVLNDNTIGVDGWKDVNTNNVFDNVFTMANKCDLPASLENGKEFYFDTNTTNIGACSFCDMLDHPPAMAFTVINISNVGCE